MVAHREHAPRGVAGDHLGHEHRSVAREVRGDLRGDARLALEVELLAQPLAELAE
jgi:hypothetical protein